MSDVALFTIGDAALAGILYSVHARRSLIRWMIEFDATHRRRVLEALADGEEHSEADLFYRTCAYEIPARIAELRAQGHAIEIHPDPDSFHGLESRYRHADPEFARAELERLEAAA